LLRVKQEDMSIWPLQNPSITFNNKIEYFCFFNVLFSLFHFIFLLA
jgi:hypothetical protein